MIGSLPKELLIDGSSYEINPDYRNVLTIIQAFNDEDLNPKEKAFIMFKRLFKSFEKIPQNDYTEAYQKAMEFIACEKESRAEKKKKPQVVDWEKDEMMLFPAVNKVAGFEVRAVEFMHWWTFLGLFQGISTEDTYGFILSIRQKRARHKKLEKHEQEFFNRNREICDLHFQTRQDAEDEMEKIFRELAGE
mgnify:CR=1 FL=1